MAENMFYQLRSTQSSSAEDNSIRKISSAQRQVYMSDGKTKLILWTNDLEIVPLVQQQQTPSSQKRPPVR